MHAGAVNNMALVALIAEIKRASLDAPFVLAAVSGVREMESRTRGILMSDHADHAAKPCASDARPCGFAPLAIRGVCAARDAPNRGKTRNAFALSFV